MSDTRPPPTPPSPVDGGVRVLRRPGWRARAFGLAGLAALALGAVTAYLWNAPVAKRAGSLPTQSVVAPADSAVAASMSTSTPPPPVPRRVAAPRPLPDPPDPPEEPASDPNDLASYFSPGDEEPTMAEIIDGLRHAGITTGLAAFNPPGTSPPLEGIAVPDDFALPEGYVRHHQVTDDGEPIEPILMFSPDYVFHDDQGRPIDLPADRVVPPELAPPGLPIRPVLIPNP